MSAIVEKIVETFWPWESGQALYQTLSRLLLTSSNSGSMMQQVRLSLISPPGYLDSIVQDALDTIRFRSGRKPKIKVKLSTRDVSNSLRYGLVESRQTLLVTGDKSLNEQFLGQVRDSIVQDTHDSRINTPRILSVSPENWLDTSPATSSPLPSPTGPSNALRGLGITGILVVAIAGLLLLANRRGGDGGMSHLQEAASHLERRGFHNPQLVRQASVEEGEKFFFQTPEGDCTVVVDKKGRIFSWSRIPSGSEESS